MKLDIGAPHGGVPKSLDERIASVRMRISAAAKAAGRDPTSVRLLGVAKKQPLQAVMEAARLGVHDIGESYVQEARLKYADAPSVPGLRKHFIGHVQTNKAKAIVEFFDVVQSIDRLEAGLAVGRASKAAGKPVTVLVQLNISPVERFGVAPAGAVELAERLREEGLLVDGVMAIGPRVDDRGELERAFTRAARVFERVGGTTLSLGMSGDFCEAIACGSTMVRVGASLFGARA
jgi:pyridoxal phosphate enzyme (YggS family)